MIKVNIEINQNKLEEFVRVLLPEHYDILLENSENDVEISVNFLKDKNDGDLENCGKNCGKLENIEKNKFETITVNTLLIDNENRKLLKKVVFSYKKVSEEYFDQAEVMAKSSLMELFNKKNEYKWGILIGVRPTKIVGRFLKMGLSYDEINEILEKIYLVSNEKRNLLLNIVKRQEPYLDKETIGIYIGIAFCPTKCSYCSFPAYLLRGKYAERYDEYIESIYYEIREIGKLTQELDLKINTIYIGGGTPSILTAEEIDKLLKTVKENYNLDYLKEFTFEAGRIDTLDEEKLTIIKSYGINKISINPQSFNERTLKLVNRYHDREQFDNVYKLAKNLGLEINMDLILGLPRETTDDILYTMDEISKYNMENLTIHNLAIKNASRLNKENYAHEDVLDYEKIYEKIENVTKNKGLFPYYMYRQKNSFQWGENLGYSVNGSESIYNIEMIEENKTIIGIGAGAITKLIWFDEKKNRDNIKRLVNPKDPLVWMNELSERLEQKKVEIEKLFENNLK